jgi:hypothetical protein
MMESASRSFTLHRKLDGQYGKLENEFKSWANEVFNQEIFTEDTNLHQKLKDGQLLCE